MCILFGKATGIDLHMHVHGSHLQKMGEKRGEWGRKWGRKGERVHAWGIVGKKEKRVGKKVGEPRHLLCRLTAVTVQSDYTLDSIFSSMTFCFSLIQHCKHAGM